MALVLHQRLRESDFIKGADRITNGNIESWASATDLNDWSEAISGSSTVNRESSDVFAGTYSCRFDIDGSNSVAHIAQNISLAAGKWHIVTIQNKASTTPITSYIQIQNNTTSNYLQDDLSTWGANNTIDWTPTLAWAENTWIFKAETTAIYNFKIARGSAPNESLYFDNVSIKEVYFLGKGTQANHGIPANAPNFTTDHAGRANGALVLNGTTDYIDLQTGGGIADNWTIAGRFYSGSVAGNDFMFEWRPATGSNNLIRILLASNKVRVDILDLNYDVNSQNKRYLGNTTILDNTWYHLAITWDGTNLEIYLNGVADTPYTKSTDDAVTMSDTTRNRNIGRDTVGANHWNGNLNDWRVNDNVLSPAEILSLKTVTDEYYQVSIDSEMDFAGALTGRNPAWLTLDDKLTWLGEWDTTYGYVVDDVVIYKTADGNEWHVFVSKITHNVGNVPATSPTAWRRLYQESYL